MFHSTEKKYSLEEYLFQEERSEPKHEFFNGKVKEVSGVTFNHGLIAVRFITELIFQTRNRNEKHHVLGSSMKIYVPQFNHIIYPGAVVLCKKPILFSDRNDVLLNPLLVVEILSPSTEDYDRNLKFHKYKTLPSFKEYVLVSQEKPWICASFREKSNVWVDTLAEGEESSIKLNSIGCEISLARVFEDVVFDKNTSS